MGKITIKKKIYWTGGTLIALLVCLIVYITFLFFFTNISKHNVGAARTYLTNLVHSIEAGDYHALEDYRGIYVLNTGEIIKSTIPSLSEGTKINMHRFSSVDQFALLNGNSYFQSPILNDGEQIGILAVDFSNGEVTLFQKYGILMFIPIFFITICIVIIIFKGCFFISHDITAPIKEISLAAKDILYHNYNTKITYDYDGEIGQLCHDLEAIRDELYYTEIREEKLKKNEKELLACISHDLKTPLSSISGYIEGIKNGVVKEQEQIDRYFNIVITKTKFLSKLIDDILIHSKAELNEFIIQLKEVYAKELFEEIFADISIDIIQHGFYFTYDTVPNILIMADKNRMIQVIQNIISNSIKYIDNNGKISVSFQIYEKELVISITDNGKGISSSDLPFIFDKFYRGEKARTMNIPGSGLGLNITKYIIEKHGGHIECDSVLNKGTTIRFSIKIC